MAQVRLDLVDVGHRPVVAELDIGRDTVEVRYRSRDHASQDRPVAVLERKALSAWLAHPDGLLTCGDDGQMSWGWSGLGVFVHIRDLVPSCFLRPDVIEHLRLYL
jgi:hypothetical protein